MNLHLAIYLAIAIFYGQITILYVVLAIASQGG